MEAYSSLWSRCYSNAMDHNNDSVKVRGMIYDYGYTYDIY